MPIELLRKITTSLTWRLPTEEKVLYLTFDDGPIPVVTPWVLDQLGKYQAKATFFCVGNNVRNHPEIFRRLNEEGHRVGNHTEHHTNGWTVLNREYYLDIALCARVVKSDLFRPPYGKIRPTQVARLRKDYRIVMWDVLSKDYDQDLDGDTCYDRVVREAKPGSIIVFHDSIKAEERLRVALPRVLEHFSSQGFRFAPIP
ncbi:MAG: polysaccharide deacetylase family protein [Bacteroidota bacterium]